MTNVNQNNEDGKASLISSQISTGLMSSFLVLKSYCFHPPLHARWIIVTGEQEAQAAVLLEAVEKQLPQVTRILLGPEARTPCEEIFR